MDPMLPIFSYSGILGHFLGPLCHELLLGLGLNGLLGRSCVEDAADESHLSCLTAPPQGPKSAGPIHVREAQSKYHVHTALGLGASINAESFCKFG